MKEVALLLLALAVIKYPKYAKSADIFDDQPKILVNNGNLVLESADSKNVSIHLKGRSHFLINNIAVFDSLNPRDRLPGKDAVGGFSHDVKTLQAQLSNLKSTIHDRYGILKRLEQLELGVSADSSSSRGSRGRSRALDRKLSRLELKVANITDRLMQDHCKSYPCQNGGTCFNMFDSFGCECTDSWQGPTCTLDVNECSKFKGTELGCQNGATCMNVVGSYGCLCKDEWKGQHCTSHKMDCLSVSGREICGQGLCVQAKNNFGFSCICEQGWRQSNDTQSCTIDIDECNEMRPHCSNNPKVMCINTPGSFVCGPCPPGYIGNGFSCDDIDECEINNGGCSVLPKVECINRRGSSRCGNCPPGYAGDGKTCMPDSIRPSFECADSSICNEYAQCFEYPNLPPACQCGTGYAGNGFGENGCTFVEVDACSALKCQNGGTCVHKENSVLCECPIGVSGVLCQLTSDPCASNPCLNEGNCTDAPTRHGYKCSCVKGFMGENCENQVRRCGGVRSEENGTIRYPENTLEPYAHNSRCAWLIKTNNTKVLNVTFTKFNVEGGAGCYYDWLQVHDGRSSSSHMIGRFCGSTLPNNGTIISTHHEMYLWFSSNNNSAHDGFELKWETMDPICGGELNVTSHGMISSPGSPGKYPSNRDCEWFIVAPPGKRIQFLFHTLMIEAHETCAYDYVEVHTGLGTLKPSLGKFCNTSNPLPLTTPSHTATVHFHSDADSSDAGFRIAFAVIDGFPGCGGTFTGAKGEIMSPMDSTIGGYKNNLYCDYVFQMPYDSRVRIEFSKFALEKTFDCQSDRIEVFEGNTYDEEQLIGRYCGSDMPPVITSQTNILTVKFFSDGSLNDEGFIFTYQLICGGVFAFDHGTISSPNYPNPYEGFRNCEYDIVAPYGQSIVLNVLDMDIEHIYGCDFDNLQIFDGVAADDSLSLGKFCGQTKPPATFVSSFNHLRVQFSSDATANGRGFQANYSFIDVECGGILNNASSVITPPGDIDKDGSYKPNANCRWLVYAPPGHVIQMTFLNFDLKPDPDCKHDFLTIFNNGNGNGEAVGPFCGTKIPKILTTPDNIAMVLFHSGSNTTHEGFTISLDFIDATRRCGGHFYSSQGSLKSPGSPKYLNNKVCEWIITAPPNQQIELIFEYFALESDYGFACKDDLLQIRNGGDSSAPLIGAFCGNTVPLPIRSLGNQLYLKFVSDVSINDEGFKIKWDATSVGCGGRLTGMNGSISSPNYPESYAHNAQCEWQISVNEGYTIEIIFTDLDLEVAADCKSNYLEIFDGDNSDSKSVVVCSAGHQPKDIETSGNHALLRMVSDVSQAGRGFFLRYSTNCNRTIRADSGVLESPNFPHNYPKNIDCAWTIAVPKGNRINYQFSHLQMEPHNRLCKHDWLEIAETGTTTKQKYCNNPTSPKTSFSNEMTVAFHSDATVVNLGFRMEWYIEGCGGKLTQPQGTLTSPNNRPETDNGLVCIWEISVEYGHRIEIKINDIGSDPSLNCVVYAYDRDFNDTIAKFCSDRDKNHVTTSRGHQLFVKLESHEVHRSRGLQITYKSVLSHCGGSFFGSQGVISSADYPFKNYENNKTCEWYLKTDGSHTIVLKLFDFMLETSVNCTKDFVEILDPVLGKQLWKGCGSEFTNKSTIKSERNEMLVRLVTDNEITARGFEAQYTTNCGSRIVTNSSGMVQYQRDKDDRCLWTIISEDPSKKIVLTFTHVSVFHDNDTCFARIEIFEGFSDTGPLKKSFCGSKTPPAIYSYGDALTVKLDTSEIAYVSEFEFYYSVLDNDCGGNYLTTMEGEFSSPKFPDSTPLNTQCIWTIRAASGNEMSLTFNNFDIASSPNCIDNYLEVRKNNQNGDLIGFYCGNELPASSSSESFWIKYQTDGSTTNAGFLAAFMYKQHSDLVGSSGSIESPRFNKFLSRIVQQTYRIIVKGSAIRLEFPVFYVQQNDECSTFMEVYNGYDRTAPIIDDESCSRSPQPILSDENIVFITFNSRFMLEAKVQIKWKEVDKVSSHTVSNGCGDKVILLQNETDVVNITSPGYPDGYEGSLNCNWTIMSGIPSFHPTVMVRDVDLEDTTGCIADYLKISSDREDGSWKELTTMCTSDIRERKAFDGTPNLLLEFKSDYNLNRTGFNVVTFLECGGKLTGSEGIIEYITPNTPRPRLVYECQWNITVRRGKTIQFEFIELNIINLTDACTSYVTIRNGIDGMSPFLGQGQYCGSVPAKLPETSSNRGFVKFKADYQLNHAFKLRYVEVQHECGGEIRLTHQSRTNIFSTPNYPNILQPHIECIWTIIAPIGERIRIDFIEKFELTADDSCADEYVEIRDGLTAAAPMIGTFCAKKPSTQRSKSNVMMIKFFTDVTEPKRGFKVNSSIDVCGGSIMSNTGFLTSTNYPAIGAYPKQAQCDYRITGDELYTFSVTLVDLDLPPPLNDTHCDLKKDHLVLYSVDPEMEENFDKALVEIATLCGNTTSNTTYSSDTNELLVRLNSFSKTKHLYRGFRMSYNTTVKQCGGNIRGEMGILTSPGYPSKSLKRMNCLWEITVPKGRRVKLEMLDVDLNTNSNLLLQRIGIYNDFTFYNRIKLITGRSEQSPVYSSDNKMLVVLSVFQASTNHGVKLQFSSDSPTICHGNLNENEGVIYPPSGKNATSYICEYTREDKPIIPGVANGGTIALHFKNLVVGIDISICRRSITGITVKRLSGGTAAEQDLAEICADRGSNDLIVASPFSRIMLEIRQSDYGHLNFTMKYKTHACGGHHNNPGSIVISNLETSIGLETSTDVDCAWFLKYEEGSGVFINITKLQLKLSCSDEYITIYDGPTARSPVLDVLCNSIFPKNGLISQKSTVFIMYHTSNYVDASKDSVFELKISSANDRCGGSFTKGSTGLKTPLYDKSYPPNTECIWEIRSERGTNIGLTFVDRFFIEDSENCTKDYVEVFEFSDSEWRSLGKRCGRNLPKPFNSTTERMKVIFRSDASGNGDGFSAVWDQNCGGVFKVASSLATISSPGFPNNYLPNLFCNYTFIAPSKSYLTLNFPEFSLETASFQCSVDNVTVFIGPKHIYESSQSTLEKIGVFCGTNGPQEQRAYEIATVIFQTDEWVQKQGFTLTYQLEACGGAVTAAEIVTTPKIDVSPCQWNITAPVGKKIVIKFEKLTMGQSSQCYNNFIELYNGTKIDESQRLAKLCGNLTNLIKPIVIESSEAVLLWTLEEITAETGFSAAIYFRPKCDEKIEITSDRSFTLDKSNQNFSESMECVYKIVGEPLSSIKMTFTSINLSICDPDMKSGRCDCDYVEVYDGNGPFSPLLGERYCGYDLPRIPDIISTGSSLYVRFVTDSIRPSTGFTANFAVVPSLCSSNPYLNLTGNETDPTTLTTPVQPGSNKYPPNIRCTWIVEAPEGMIFDIQFDKFEIEDSLNCENDSLTIEDDNVKEYVTEDLGKEVIYSGKGSVYEPSFYSGISGPTAPHVYCGSKLPHDYISDSKKIRIYFKTNSENEFSGISFKLRTLRSCSRNFTALTGRMLSTHDMNNCNTTIRVPENFTISLFFHRFWMFEQDCTKSFLKVYDGNFDSGILLKTLCGYASPDPIFSSQNQLSLFQFSEDIGVQGFYEIFYVATDKGRGCGGEIYNYGGLFSSPMYPSANRSMYDCTWIVTVPQNLKVALRFSVFDLGSKIFCNTNYIEFLEESLNGVMTSIKRYCGEDVPATYVSTRSTMKIRYKQTVNFAGTGWMLNFIGVLEGAKPKNW